MKKYVKKYKVIRILILLVVFSMLFSVASLAAENPNSQGNQNGLILRGKITSAERKAAADAYNALVTAAAEAGVLVAPALQLAADNTLVPDYFGVANWANSPPLEKFVNSLAGLGPDQANDLGQYIPVAVADQTTWPGDDYYEIAVVEYKEKMHRDLPATTHRGYVQLSTAEVPGKQVPLFQLDGITPILKADGSAALAVDDPHYLGPAIVSDSGRPVRIKFYNLLPIGVAGDLFIPTDTTVMGSGEGPAMGQPGYTQNRANVHLHGNNTVWISDGSPHQWITPANEATAYPQGVSVVGVPDMTDATETNSDGQTTLYYTNTQSARLMFYHDHSFGITRLNVYVGEAAPYIIRDDVEKDLINGTNLTGVNPNGFMLPQVEIPLVIQDATFVDANTVLTTDPTWTWGTEPYTPGVPYVPTTGDLWYPHVYMPAQNPYAADGVNPFGRWMYGPWFYPPTGQIEFGPVLNPYYTPDLAPSDPNYRPPVMPGTPNVSTPGESFMDTPIVNGTAYPFVNLDPKAYRFRILNAANDRFFNLQLYVADDTYLPGTPGYLTEVKMIPATTEAIPSHLEQYVPDPAMKGPDWIQIGTEGGFLPTPAIIPSQPTTWNLTGTAFNFGNVDQHSLELGTAERADVIVDFPKYAGKTLILYNDAPAPFPANDPRYDYYTNCPDRTAEGGAPSTLPGFGPNTRTIMQIRISGTVGDTTLPAFDLAGLQAVFNKGSIPASATAPANTGVFATSQETIIMPQAAYNSAYNVTNLPADAQWAYVQLDENDKTFQPIDKDGILQPAVTLPLEPKAMHDEMSGVYDAYGRMSGFLGLTSPKATSINAPFLAYGYSSPPTDLFNGMEDDLDSTMIGTLEDGTQIWQITSNGVDTHTIHTHLFSAQLINRVAWDGAMLPPDDNELGWKETFRVNPLEQTVIAMRPKVPAADTLPWPVPNSVRLIDPTMPDGAVLPVPPPESWFDPQGNILAQVINHRVNFGWEYVWHCHILSHEEMDMMHSLAVAVKPIAPSGLVVVRSGSGNKKADNLTWLDNSANETNFIVQRSATAVGPWTTLATLPANTLTYANTIGNTNNAYYYQVLAINTVGDTVTPGFQTITRVSPPSNVYVVGSTVVVRPAAPSNLTASLQAGPQVQLNWLDNSVNETGFVIERSANGAAFANLITVAAKSGTGNISYTDTTVQAGITYTYRVASINSAGLSTTWSNTATAAVAAAPAAPTLVAATATKVSNRNARVTLTWQDTATETSYVIEGATNATFTANLMTAIVAANSTSYQSGNVSRNTPYYFRIRAVNDAGPSAWVNANPFPVMTP